MRKSLKIRTREHIIILFDNDCTFCNFWVQFIIKRDKKDKFRMASLESDFGKDFRQENSITTDSIILLLDKRIYIKSSAAIEIIRHLQGVWKLVLIFKFLPISWRDRIYDCIAKNRYKWFGKTTCDFNPNENVKNKYLV